MQLGKAKAQQIQQMRLLKTTKIRKIFKALD
jgi:hypothetical protein